VRSLSANRGAFQRAVTTYGTLASAAFDLSLHWNLSSDQRSETRREYRIHRLILYSVVANCDKHCGLIVVLCDKIEHAR